MRQHEHCSCIAHAESIRNGMVTPVLVQKLIKKSIQMCWDELAPCSCVESQNAKALGIGTPSSAVSTLLTTEFMCWRVGAVRRDRYRETTQRNTCGI